MQVPNKRRIFFSEILWISLCLLRTFQRFYWLKISFDISDICVIYFFILRTNQCLSDYKTIYLVFFFLCLELFPLPNKTYLGTLSLLNISTLMSGTGLVSQYDISHE